jgi:hypothetical protein
MNEEITRDMPGAYSRSFEERLFARFDALEAIPRDFSARLQKIEALADEERLAWEQFLREAVEMRKEATEMRRELSKWGSIARSRI